MADPLLTTLCSICHTAVPRYTCPACHTHTCSLACSQKHKAWANCTGRRDPTAYMPAARLRTPAGVDHDYNFLSAIERERDRNQREIVEERGLFSEKQLRELGEERRWRKMWFGEEVRFVSNDRNHRGAVFGSDGEDGEEEEGEEDGGGEGGERTRTRTTMMTRGGPPSALARRVRQRLDQANVEVVHMPVGMARQRENTTAWNRKAGRINWCMEWIVYDAPGSGAGGASTRIRHKALETIPLYKALGNSLAWSRKGQYKDEEEDEEDEDTFLSAYARKRRRVLIKEVKEEGRRSAMQDADEATWLAIPYTSQNPYTGTWDTDRAATVSSWLPDELIDAKRHHSFYLLRPLTPAGKPKELIPLDSTETLGRALMGRTVLEFPTVYVFPPPPSQAAATVNQLPEGFILGSTERRVRERKNNKSEKRKAMAERGGERSSQPPHKRQAVGEDGIPMRGGRHDRGRGRGRGGPRGQGGGRGQQHRRGGDNVEDAEEGEINSDGDDFRRRTAQGVGDGADTTSSDPDTSSDDDNDGSLGGMSGDEDNSVLERQGDPPTGGIWPGSTATGKPSGLGLVDYGSDSDEDAESGGSEEDVDVSELKPENPELVAGAIQEIVGLLT